MIDQVRVFDRRGAVKRKPQRKTTFEMLMEADAAFQADLAKRGLRDRFFKEEGEFEPAMLHPFEDLDIIRELIDDPYTRIWWGERNPQTKKWRPFYNKNGERLIKVTRGLEADIEHQERNFEVFGDHSISNTHGEQEEAARRANWNKLKMDEEAMDFRPISRDIVPGTPDSVTDFDLPDFPENVSHWLEHEAWPTYNHVLGWISNVCKEIAEHEAQGDNNEEDVAAIRKAEQERMLNAKWAAFWKGWMHRVGKAKNLGRYPPMTRKQLASIKAVIESFRVAMDFETPAMRFWAKTACLNCGAESNTLLNLATKVAFCKPCGQLKAEVIEFEQHEVLDVGPPEYDWFEVAADIQEQIRNLEEEKAELKEIDRLRRRLLYIERIHIKLDCDNLLYSSRSAIEDRYI